MRRLLSAALFVIAAGAAWAAAYDDYMRGFEAARAGNADMALTAYTAALSAGDLSPAYVPNAYFGRADAYYRKGRCADAVADLDMALKLRPSLLDALVLRAHANDCLGRHDAALADLDAAIAVAPTVDLYSTRANQQWFHGNFALAAEDYLKAVSLQPKRAYDPRSGGYALTWYAISAARAKTFNAAAFSASARTLDLDDWPAPLIGFIAGKTPLADVYRHAARGEGEAPKHHKCEADFFIGEWQVSNGNMAGKALLQGVEQTCAKNTQPVHAARTDLKRLP